MRSLNWTLIFLLALTPCLCDNRYKFNLREKEKEILNNIFNASRYDPRILPNGDKNGTGPVIVKVNLFVRSISNINDFKMEYNVQLTFRQQWEDDRLKFNDYGGKVKLITISDSTLVWTPDLFFSNEKSASTHNLLMPNSYIRIYPDGTVLYSTRISLKLSCPMNLRFYPMDYQLCSLRMASYGMLADNLVFLWKIGDPVQVVRNLQLATFSLQEFGTDYCTSKTNTGNYNGHLMLPIIPVPLSTKQSGHLDIPESSCNLSATSKLIGEYSCLKVDFLFKREITYYLLQLYIPSCLLVFVSWLSFWLDRKKITARLLLVLLALLGLILHITAVNKSISPVSYAKAIDVWNGVCLTVVVGVLLEIIVISYLLGMEKGDQAGHENSQNNIEVNNKILTWLKKTSKRSEKIEKISIVAIPAIFALFNFFYWLLYLILTESNTPKLYNSVNYGPYNF